MSKPTLADDCSRMIKILADAPKEGLSYQEIADVCIATGEAWSFRTITQTLCALGRKITSEKNRPQGKLKATRFRLNTGQ